MNLYKVPATFNFMKKMVKNGSSNVTYLRQHLFYSKKEVSYFWGPENHTGFPETINVTTKVMENNQHR